MSLSLTPGITTSYSIQFDDVTRRTFVNPINFGASAVDTTSNTITFANHGYKTGDKVVYKSSSAITPLLKNFTYFLGRIDDNTFRLCETFFKSKKIVPDVISFTSTGSGHTIALINPPIELTRGYTVGFAVSDTSLTQVISGKRREVFDFIGLDDYDVRNFAGEKYGDLNALTSDEYDSCQKLFGPLIQNWDNMSMKDLMLSHGPFTKEISNERLMK